MDMSLMISLLALALSCLAVVVARQASQSREFNAYNATVKISDADTGVTRTFGLSATASHTATRASWVAELTKHAVARMAKDYPSTDVQRWIVDIQSIRFHNTRT